MNNQMKWTLDFFVSDMTLGQQIKMLKKVNKWDKIFKRNETDLTFFGVRALEEIRQYLNGKFTIQPRMLLGRLTSGAQRDHGQLVHAVIDCGSKALCGAKPGGKRSVGWSEPESGEVTCKECLKRMDIFREVYASFQD